MGGRRVYEWVGVLACQNEEQLEDFLDKQKKRQKSKSQPEICTVCELNVDVHLMRYRLFICTDKTCSNAFPHAKCKWTLKVLQCCETKSTTVFQDSNHLSLAPPTKCPHEMNCAMKRYVKVRAHSGDKPAYIMNSMVCNLDIQEAVDKKKLLARIQSTVRSYRKKMLNDNDYVDVMESESAKYKFRENLNDSTGFVFGFDQDEGGRCSIGGGTDEDPVVIGFTSKILIRRLGLCSNYILHVDATFKLNSKGFPVGVIGVRDVWRQFHPVAFFLMSGLKIPQWSSVFKSTFELYTVIIGDKVQIKFVMMDADDSQRGAFENVYRAHSTDDELPTFLMCFFHVMTNVRKRVLRLPADKKKLIYRHVYRIHYARTEAEKDLRVREAMNAWENDSECQSFASYFNQQWLGDQYKNWQCVITPTGFAKTNNPVENFNRQLKNQHSLRRLLRLNPLFAELLKVSRVWSVLRVNFALSPRASPHVVREYRKSLSGKKLTISKISRGSISFLTGSGDFRVIERLDEPMALPNTTGLCVPAEDGLITQVTRSDLEAEKQIDEQLQNEVQDTFG